MAAVWIVLLVALGGRISFLGGEAAVLGRARGADLQSRTDLAFQARRLESRLEQEAGAAALDERIRRIGLRLAPPALAGNR
jgi:hypothetical protein